MLDRRVNVAPMVDWTDWGNSGMYVNDLRRVEKHRSLSVASQLRITPG